MEPGIHKMYKGNGSSAGGLFYDSDGSMGRLIEGVADWTSERTDNDKG